MSISTVYAHIKAFFTEADTKIEAEWGEIHAVISNLGTRVAALEEAAKIKAEAIVAAVVTPVAVEAQELAAEKVQETASK